ncbi:MATE family efflux transporter [Natronococcus jeotgali]|uniref:Putative efflux protein, MATE family n=1 Tax=Natronococcus jeotgali DSM 18795 TaxID=1227498 RepID=L9XGG0_9EURY|nr:MATE family efflux transporter [Natronococcus jeotgali]ELY60819.1 putative efflux protein, MATE family [Natronococcus jeotgali DSM 18795]
MSRNGRDRSVDVIDGGLVWPLVVLSAPIVLTNLLMVGYNLADTFWVGRLGQAGVSALSFSWAIIFLVISFGIGFNVAGTVLVAQNKGAGNLERIAQVAGQTISVILGLSALVAVVGFVLAPAMLRFVGAEPGTLEYEYALAYTRTEFAGMPFIFAFFVFQSLLQGWGDTRTPLYLMSVSVALNVVIDPFFILGFQDNVAFAWLGLEALEARLFALTGFDGWAVQGAAFATILSRGLAAAVGIWLLLSGRVGIELSTDDFRPERETVRELVAIGAPASVEVSTKAFSVTILTALVALAGPTAVAGYGIGTRVTSMVVLPALGLARGVETVVGQNLGAGQVGRAERGVYVATGLVAGGFLLFSGVVYALADPIVGVFVAGSGSAAVTAVGAEYLRIVSLSYVFLGAFYVVQGAFRGSGSTRTAMGFAIVGFIVLRPLLAYGLAEPLGLGATGVFVGDALTNALIVVLAGAYLLRGTWTESVVEPDADREAEATADDRSPAATGPIEDHD